MSCDKLGNPVTVSEYSIFLGKKKKKVCSNFNIGRDCCLDRLTKLNRFGETDFSEPFYVMVHCE